MSLVAIIDWLSRYVLAWQLSHTLEPAFCLEALHRALVQGCPQLFNTDQGVQCTSRACTGCLAQAGVMMSMDGRGRALDNIFVERLWRSVTYADLVPERLCHGPRAYRGPGQVLPILQRSAATSTFGLSNASGGSLAAVRVSGQESTLFLAFGGLDNGVKHTN